MWSPQRSLSHARNGLEAKYLHEGWAEHQGYTEMTVLGTAFGLVAESTYVRGAFPALAHLAHPEEWNTITPVFWMHKFWLPLL